MDIMELWMNLDELEGANTKRNYKGRDGESLVKSFKYRQPFGLNFRYNNQVDNKKNRLQYPISLDRTWDTKFWMDCKFSWYLAVPGVNRELASGHFQNGGDIMPTLDFGRQLEIQCMESTIETHPGDIGSTIWACRRPKIAEYNLEKVPNYFGKWLPREKFKRSKHKYQNQRCKNH